MRLPKLNKEIVLTSIILALVWYSLFSHRLPLGVQSILFVLVLLLEGALVLSGWLLSRTLEHTSAKWKRTVGVLGLWFDTAAIAISVWSFFYILQFPFGAINWLTIVPICLVLCLCGLIAGLLSSREIRPLTILSAVIWASVLVAIPFGVL
jgi:hypothetical protein